MILLIIAKTYLQSKEFQRLKTKLLIIICLLVTSLNVLFAQIPAQDSTLVDSTSILLDSIMGSLDVGQDTSELGLVKISSSAPADGIDYVSRDSMISAAFSGVTV